jgi:hypothetical protein
MKATEKVQALTAYAGLKGIPYLVSFLLFPGSNIALCLLITFQPQKNSAAYTDSVVKAKACLITDQFKVSLETKRWEKKARECTIVGESAGIANTW